VRSAMVLARCSPNCDNRRRRSPPTSLNSWRLRKEIADERDKLARDLLVLPMNVSGCR